MSFDRNYMKCPFCKENIKSEAIKCRYCGEWLKELQAQEIRSKIKSSKRLNFGNRLLTWLLSIIVGLVIVAASMLIGEGIIQVYANGKLSFPVATELVKMAYDKLFVGQETTPTPSITPKNVLISSTLHLGSTGDDVKILQVLLKGVVSGYYGELTRQAVINFQKVNGLSQTGNVDNLTINKINEIYGSKSRQDYLNEMPKATSAPNVNIVNVNQTQMPNQTSETSSKSSKVPVALPNGNTYNCDQSAVQAIRDAGQALSTAEQQKTNCYEKYGLENRTYNTSCIDSCNGAYGLDKPNENSTCKNDCAIYNDKMTKNMADICNTYSQAQKSNLDNLISRYCQ